MVFPDKCIWKLCSHYSAEYRSHNPNISGDSHPIEGTVNFTLNRPDYTHERCQAVIPWIPVFSDNHQLSVRVRPAMMARAPPGSRSLAIVVNRCAKSISRSFMVEQGREGCAQEQDGLQVRYQVITSNSPRTGERAFIWCLVHLVLIRLQKL